MSLSLERDGVPAAANVLPLRASAPTAEPPPEWLTQLPDRPRVYVTLGTIFNDLPRLRLLLDALADLDLNVVVTIGRDRNPEDLMPCPANSVVRQFVPQDLLPPHMQATVTRAGSGSMLAALAHGVPMVMLPRGADQLENADACRDLGISVVLRPEELTADRVRTDLTAILSQAAYVHNATAVA